MLSRAGEGSPAPTPNVCLTARKEPSIMETPVIQCHRVPRRALALLIESTTNPRRIFEDDALKELAESIRTQGVLSPLLVRPFEKRLRDHRRSPALPRRADGRGATVPVRIVNLTDAEALERPVGRKSDTHGRSPDGRGAGIPRSARPGGAEVHHRADRREGGQIARLRGISIEVD